MKFWDYIPAKSLVWDPAKKATGLTDAQLAGVAALAVAPFAAPALMGAGAAGAAGAGTAGTAGATAGATGGLLNFAGTQAAAPIANASVAATPEMTAGLSASSGSSLAGYGKAAMSGLQGAQMAKGLLSSPQTPMQAPQLPQYQDMSGLLNANQGQIEALQQKRMARRGLFGG